MAYFLKKCKKNGKEYLSIVNSFYDGKRGHTVHETYASYGTGQTLIDEGIENPIKYLEEKIEELNQEENLKKVKQINEVSPIKYAGHFLIKSVLDKLEIEKILNIYDLTVNYQFKLFDVLSSLIYSRIIKPCSKYKTFYEVIPYLDEKYYFSYDQLLSGLSYFGRNYERIVEIFTKQVKEKYKLDINTCYFDCTNFYFEIDKEDDNRKKGKSKENRTEPLLGMGLLLDHNQIPVGLKLYPGNESEKPKLREVINDLKKQNGVNGRIIQVADKGLNSAYNIYQTLKEKDGYLFSKSVKMIPEKEKVWLLLDNDYKEVKDKNENVLYKTKECIDIFPYEFFDENGKKVKFTVKEKRVATYNPSLAKKQLMEINKLVEKASSLSSYKAKKSEFGESGKYVTFKGKDGSEVTTELNEKKINEDKELCGYNLLVTSEINVDQREIYKSYHNLWRIEESFRIMKSELDARPVFVKTKETIHGHFLICYLSVLLSRLLQIYELKDEDSMQSIYGFIRDFKLVKTSEIKYVNMATISDFITKLTKKTKLPLTNAIISKNQYKKIMSYKI